MEVTKIRYFSIERKSDNHPLAACSIVFDGVFMIHDVKIYGGGVVVMPQRGFTGTKFAKTNQHRSNDVCHPVDKDFFESFKQHVLDGYKYFQESGKTCYYPLN